MYVALRYSTHMLNRCDEMVVGGNGNGDADVVVVVVDSGAPMESEFVNAIRDVRCRLSNINRKQDAYRDANNHHVLCVGVFNVYICLKHILSNHMKVNGGAVTC